MRDPRHSQDAAAPQSLRRRPGQESGTLLLRRPDPVEGVTCRSSDRACASAHASTLRRASGAVPSGQSLLRLQREYGNRFVRRVLALSRDSEEIQEGGEIPPAVEQSIQRAQGGGQALDEGARARMEPAFGADFSGVRVHTGAEADHLNQRLSARAFTAGSDIFFRQGEYSPGSSTGRELLAHELTHVVQGGGKVQTRLTLGPAKAPAEEEAESVAREVMQQENKEDDGVRRQPATAGGVVRRLTDETQKTDQLRLLLKDGDEKGAIDLMGRLSETEVQSVLGSREFKELAIDAFNNDEMYRGVHAMKGDLYPSLEWMFDEGADWDQVKAVVKDAPSGHDRVRTDNWMKEKFTKICNDEEMAEAVKLLKGTLLDRLKWLVAEEASAKWIFEAIRLAPNGDLAEVAADKDGILGSLRDLLSKADYRLAEQMVKGGLLYSEEIKQKYKEQHYERQSPTSPWELKSFGATGAYEIRYTRTELRLVVRIRLKGTPVPDAQKNTWLGGIQTYWKDKFHLENGRKIPIVFEPIFTEDNPHHTVEVHSSGDKCSRADMTNWCHSPTFTSATHTVAHEFGHMLALEDEYRLNTADYTRLMGTAPPGPGPEPAGGYTLPGIMGDKASGAQPRHLSAFVTWLNNHRLPGESLYRLVPGPP